MNTVTETVLRRAVSQAASLVKQSQIRSAFTDTKPVRPARTAATQASTQAATSDLLTSDEELHELHTEEQTQKTINDLPGPKGYPLVGTVPEYFRKANRGQVHELQRKFHKKFGKMFKEKMGPSLNISIADPTLVEEVLRNVGKYPNRPPYEAWIEYKNMRKLPHGIVSGQGEEWYRVRSVLQKKLLKTSVVSEYEDAVCGVTSALTDKISRIRHQETNVVPNLNHILFSWAVECVGSILFEKQFGCLKQDHPTDMGKFAAAIADMFATGYTMVVFASTHKKYNTKPWRRHVQAWDTILDTTKMFVDEKLEEITAKLQNAAVADDSDRKMTLLEYLFSSKLSYQDILMNVAELFLAGSDTTANTLSISMFVLAKNPRVQDLVHDEVHRILQGRDSITGEDIRKMKYIKAVVKEILRLYPTIPTNARVLEKESMIDNYLIPKGTIVMLNTYTMCRSEENFSNPDEFIPERWLRSGIGGDSDRNNPFTALPFGFGVRSCLGRRIAEQMLYISLAKICQKYRLTTTVGDDFKPFVRTVLTLGQEVPVRFTDR